MITRPGSPGPSAATVQFHFLEQLGVLLGRMSALERLPDSSRTSRHVRFVPCVDGSGLARTFFTFCSIGRCSHVFGL
jgi:hypothetical protein